MELIQTVGAALRRAGGRVARPWVVIVCCCLLAVGWIVAVEKLVTKPHTITEEQNQKYLVIFGEFQKARADVLEDQEIFRQKSEQLRQLAADLALVCKPQGVISDGKKLKCAEK